MTTNTEGANRRAAVSGGFSAFPSLQASQEKLFTLSFSFLLLILLTASMALQLLHQLACDHAFVMFAFDGKHYLDSCQTMTAALLLLLKGDLSGFFTSIAGSDFASGLLWDGPVVPGVPAIFFVLAKRAPQACDWGVFAVCFSILASLGAILTAIGARILTSSNKWALTAGALFAFCPATLIATGVFRSEFIALVLTLSLLLSLCGAPRSRFAAVASGIFAGLFVMVKPVMIPVIALLCIIAAANGGDSVQSLAGKISAKIKLLFFIAVAAALPIAPWLVYSTIDCHQPSITAERWPSYNTGVGTDLQSDGWCTIPETEHAGEAKLQKSAMKVLVDSWKDHPLELSRLTIRKITRLWSQPWNDFREPIFGLPMQAQIVWHQILVALGFIGLALYFFFPPTNFYQGNSNSRLFGNLAAIALLGHLLYTFFQPMGRYGFTSLPLLTLFASYGLFVIASAFASDTVSRPTSARAAAIFPSYRALGVTAVALLGLGGAILIFNCDAMTHAGESQEVAHVLHPGEIAGRSFDFSAQKLISSAGKKQTILIMVDCDLNDQSAQTVAVHLNGHLLNAPLLPFNCLNGKNYFLFDSMAEHAGFMRVHVQDFRQWRALLVPADCDLLSKDGINEIELINNGTTDLTVFGDTQSKEPLLLPSPDYFGSDRMLVNLNSNESRIRALPVEGGLKERSFIKKVIPGRRDIWPVKDTLRLRVAAFDEPDSASCYNSASPIYTPVDLEKSLTPEQFHWYARTSQGIKLNKEVLKGVGAVGCDIDLAALTKCGPGCTQLEITLTGKVRRNGVGGPGRLGVSAALINNQGVAQGLGQFADSVVLQHFAKTDKGANDNWTAFSLSDVLPLSHLGGAANLQKLSLSFFPCARLESFYGPGRQCSDMEVKDMRISVRTLSLTDVAGKTFAVY